MIDHVRNIDKAPDDGQPWNPRSVKVRKDGLDPP